MRRTIVHSIAAAAVIGLGACATGEDTAMKLHSLEDKVNQALQNAAAAKVDANTALHMALEMEKKKK